MLKLVGAGMVVVAGSLAGMQVGKNFARRPVEIRALMGALLLLQTEVVYALAPLGEALVRVAERADPAVAPLFREAAACLRGEPGCTGAQALEAAVAASAPRLSLREEDFAVLQDLGAALGASDREDQTRHFNLALERLRAAVATAETEARRYARLY
uniref:Stage III sporulation protein AB n=1 Tax=Ammonifex degensii TaxID=42838 RepID=A0A7C1IZH4_9THEO